MSSEAEAGAADGSRGHSARTRATGLTTAEAAQAARDFFSQLPWVGVPLDPDRQSAREFLSWL